MVSREGNKVVIRFSNGEEKVLQGRDEALELYRGLSSVLGAWYASPPSLPANASFERAQDATYAEGGVVLGDEQNIMHHPV